jgi:uncharacterized protein
MIGIVEDKRAEVAALCEKYGVKRLDLFGSAAGDGFDPEASDLDFVVSFEKRDPPELFDRYFGLVEDLEALFGRISRYDAETASRISENRRIIAFRNRLIHGYDVLDDELVWETVKAEVPVLLSEVEGLLQEQRDEDPERGEANH